MDHKCITIGPGLVVAQHAASVAGEGVTYCKDPDTPAVPASTLKMMTAYVARTVVTDAMLGDRVTFTGQVYDAGQVAPALRVGDEVTFLDLLYGMMLPSHNGMARLLAHEVGRILDPAATDPAARFRAEMDAAAGGFGWSGTKFDDPSGAGTVSRMTVRQLVELMQRIAVEDPLLVDIMGTLERDICVTGPNARVVTVHHSVSKDIARFPEFIAGKTGTLPSGHACLVMMWRHPEGETHATALIGSDRPARYTDMRAVLDAVIQDADRDPNGIIVDLHSAANISDVNSHTRARLDRLYRPQSVSVVDLADRLPGIELTGPGSGISVVRSGSSVTLSVAAVKLHPNLNVPSLIPAEFWPHAWVYGSLSPNRSTTEVRSVEVSAKGRLRVYGNSAGEVLRGTLTWTAVAP